MTPKFSVGEVVIVVTPLLPQFNGKEATITGVQYGKFRGSVTGDVRTGYSYLTDLDILPFSEFALRKKHQPGELSYTELLESLTVKSGAPA